MRIAVRDPLAPDRPSNHGTGTAERLGYLALGLVITAVVLVSSRGYFTPDIKPEVYLNPLRRLAYDLSAWQPDPQLGVGNYNNGLAPVSATTSVLHALGLPPELIARLLRLTLLALGAWGAVRLYRAAAGDADRSAARLTVAAVFLFNPYAVVGGATLAVLLPYCVFPWQLIALLRALQTGRGWRWPAVFALTFFAMSGMNVAAVPVLQLVAVPAVLIFVRATTGRTWGELAASLGRCLLLAVAVSVYWWLPALSAYAWSSTVAAGSESVEGIAAPSSFAEVMRGLGLWPMYGRNTITGPWTPGFVPYLANAAVVVASFLLVALAALGARVSGSRARILGVGMLAFVAVVMVGAHPPGSSSPFGRALAWFLQNVPGALALRTTNKAGAGLALAVCLLVGLLAARLQAMRTTQGAQLAAVGLVGIVLVGAGWPALSGQGYVGRWKIPAYWQEAATDLDSDTSDSRVWFLPGQVLAHYRWNTEGVDDLNLALLDRPSLLRTVLPVSSAETTNLLAGADSRLQEGRLGGRAISVLAGYLGVDQVLLRNDTVWENARGGRPAVIQPQVDGDPGLRLAAAYGAPGQYTRTLQPGLDPDADAVEQVVEPLRRYEVLGATGIVRTESTRGTVLVDGDGFAVPDLVNAGLLAGQSFRYLGDLTSPELAALLGPSQRIVVTDSNRRRGADEHHLTNAFGPLITETQTPVGTRALYGPDAQTVARYEGIADVSATSFGSLFDVSSQGAPELALDGDPSTAWTFGSFGTAVGQALTVTLPEARDLGTITVDTGPQAGPARISALSLSAGGQTLVTDVDVNGRASFPMTGVVGDRLTLSATATTGSGINLVQIAEIEIPGVRAEKLARTPTTLTHLASGLDGSAQALLATTPVDVLLERERGTVAAADEERTLERSFSIPGPRNFRMYGLVRTTSVDVPAAASDGCTTVSSVDGRPLRIRLLEEAVSPDRSVLFEGCGPLRLGDGSHTLRSSSPWALDTLVLRDLRGESVTPPAVTPQPTVVERSSATIRITTPAATAPYLLVLGQSVDARWHATMDGAALDGAVLVDGYSAAWPVEDLAAHTFTFTYTPQRLVDASRVAAGLVLMLLVVLALRRGPSPLAVHQRRTDARKAPSRQRQSVEGVVVAVAVLVLGGIPLLPVAAALGFAHAIGWPGGRRLLGLAVGLILAVPVVWIVGNADAWGQVTPALVLDTPLAGWLAATALACLVVGVFDDERARRLGAGEMDP